ncbi:MAG: hypothetical protein COA94_07420, partial [Rickettsiales bacterium]
MDEFLNKQETEQINKKATIQMVTFGMITILVIVTLVSCIRIYSNKKEQVLNEMRMESSLLKTVITDQLNYSLYSVDIIGDHIKSEPRNLIHIHHTLKSHFASRDFNVLFGWRKYSWMDENFLEIVTSTQGVVSNPRYASFVKDIVENTKTIKKGGENKIVFYTSHNSLKGNSLKIIDNIFNAKGKYVGSAVLSYDIKTMIRSLDRRKRNSATNFVLLDKNMEVVAQSQPIIENIIDNKGEFSNYLKFSLKMHGRDKDLEYLDMFNGLNYFVSKLDELPF